MISDENSRGIPPVSNSTCSVLLAGVPAGRQKPLCPRRVWSEDLHIALCCQVIDADGSGTLHVTELVLPCSVLVS